MHPRSQIPLGRQLRMCGIALAVICCAVALVRGADPGVGRQSLVEDGPTATSWDICPDGKVIGLSLSHRITGDYRLCIADARAGQAATPYVIESAHRPIWSPQSTRLVFTRRVKTVVYPPAKSDIRVSVYSAASRSYTDVTSGRLDQGPVWSSDGTAIAFARAYTEPPQMSVEIMQRDGESFAEPVSVGKAFPGIAGLSWQPSGSMIACVGVRILPEPKEGQTHFSDLYLVDTATGTTRPLTTTGDVSLDVVPSWAPDGRCIAFVSKTPRRLNTTGSAGSFRTLETIDVRASSRQVLVASAQTGKKPVGIRDIRWSPAGAHILLDVVSESKAEERNIAMVSYPDGKLKWLTKDGKSKLPRWSTDGRGVLYIHGDTEIRQMDRDGRNDRLFRALEDCLRQVSAQ